MKTSAYALLYCPHVKNMKPPINNMQALFSILLYYILFYKLFSPMVLLVWFCVFSGLATHNVGSQLPEQGSRRLHWEPSGSVGPGSPSCCGPRGLFPEG